VIRSFGFAYDFDEMVLPFHQDWEDDPAKTVTGSWLTDPLDFRDDLLTWEAILQEEAYKYRLELKRAKEAKGLFGF
jgi:hypothetical protein